MAQKIDSLKVPGATLYHEIRGSGPVLLCIPGGPVDASVFAEMAGQLEDRYTVVSYDPRGHSRSTIDSPETAVIQTHADDAARLIDAVTSEPANVLGSSGGASIGLELVTRHADKVSTLVAHEPPVMELLGDKERWRGIFKDIHDTFRNEGPLPAMEKFGNAVQEGGPAYEPPEPTPEMAEMFARVAGNAELFFGHEILSIGGYVPDIDALKASPTRIVVAGGKESGQQGAYRAAVALAERLGIDLTYFEGGHGGAGAEGAFAGRLHEVLQG
jgi:pimeloyl-ACP methyl ester carboxylesterase